MNRHPRYEVKETDYIPWDRKAICHDHVIYTRIKYLARQPRFGGEHGAKTDFIFIECRKRQEGEVQGAAGVEFG